MCSKLLFICQPEFSREKDVVEDLQAEAKSGVQNENLSRRLRSEYLGAGIRQRL